MKALKGILVVLVIVLVVILGVGGALIGFNHDGMDMEKQIATQDDSKQTEANQNNSKKQEKATTNQQEQPKIVVVREQVPPTEYIKKIQQAQGMIKEATGLMASDPQTPPQNQTQNMGGMEKIHRGIYKMAQGLTLMDQAVEGMDNEVKNAQANDINYFQVPSTPQVPQYYGTYPYGYWVYPNQSQYPNQSSPGQQAPQHQQFPQSQQPPQDQQSLQDPQANPTTMNHNTPSIGNLFSASNITLVIYGFLFLSIIGAFIAVLGFIRSLFKTAPAPTQE